MGSGFTLKWMSFPIGRWMQTCRCGLHYWIWRGSSILKCGHLIYWKVNERRCARWGRLSCDWTWHSECLALAVWYIATSHIHITGNWTLKPTESRKEHNPGKPRSEQIKGHRGISVAPHFLGSCFFTQKALWSGPPPEGCINALSFPSPCWCWSQCHVDLLFNFAGMFSVWIL